MRVALIGSGQIAAAHAITLDGLEEATLTAACDVDLTRATALAQPRGATAYVDHVEMLGREQLDAVLVCTPPEAHREAVLDALAHGLHVYLEKPVARSPADGVAIATAVRESDLVCAVGYQYRAISWLGELRKLLAGRPLGLVAGRGYGAALARPWFIRQAAGGGQVLERASHFIDLERAIAGEVDSVFASGSRVAMAGDERPETSDIDDVIALELRFRSGALGSIAIAWTGSESPIAFALDVVAGGLVAHAHLDPSFAIEATIDGHQRRLADPGQPFATSLARFLAAAREGDPTAVVCTPDEALPTLMVADACERSLRDGVPVVCDEMPAGRSPGLRA